MKKCLICGKEYSPRKSTQKYCSFDCRNKSMVGKPSKKRNGKYIKCKTCNKEFYISKSRFSFKKYCCQDCAIKDNFGFKPKIKKCKICGKEFEIKKGIEAGKKTCSKECWHVNNRRISKIHSSKKIERTCKDCGFKYLSLKSHEGSGLCKKCRYKKSSRDRAGKNNPAYKDGKASLQKYKNGFTQKHFKECRKYKVEFKKKHGYLFCEECGVNINTPFGHDTHHIHSAGRYPKHKYLHDHRNLILLCRKCHKIFHGAEWKEYFDKWVEKRGIAELFERKIS